MSLKLMEKAGFKKKQQLTRLSDPWSGKFSLFDSSPDFQHSLPAAGSSFSIKQASPFLQEDQHTEADSADKSGTRVFVIHQHDLA